MPQLPVDGITAVYAIGPVSGSGIMSARTYLRPDYPWVVRPVPIRTSKVGTCETRNCNCCIKCPRRADTLTEVGLDLPGAASGGGRTLGADISGTRPEVAMTD